MSTICGICGLHASDRIEAILLFGELKTHMPVVCKSCREEQARSRRHSKECEFRDRIENLVVPTVRKKPMNARKLMEAHNARELLHERLEREDFIGL
jgi:hypothetical protein